MERIILFDIDRTIFDTKTSEKRVIESLGLLVRRDSKWIKEIIGEYKNELDSTTDFNPNDFLRKVSEQTEIDPEKLNQVMFNPYNFVLYPETLKVFRELSRKGFMLGIFSEGVSQWQMKKLTLTGSMDYLEPSLILIERRKLSSESVDKIPDGVTLVEDKQEVIGALSEIRPDLELFWINRTNESGPLSPRVMMIEKIEELL